MFGGKIVKNGLYMVACLMIIVSMALAGCTPAAATAAPAEANPASTQSAGAAEAPTAASQGGEQTIHLALVLGDMSNPFFSTVGDAAKAAAAAAGNVELSVLGTTTLEEQVKAVEDQISAKVDLIGVAPFDAQGITPTVEKANAAGIPIITVDETSAGGQVEAYIATDNVQGGALAGEWLVKAMDGKGKLAILEGGAGSSTNNARLEGLHSVLDKYPDITVVASLPADWARDKGMQVMNDVLTANPDLNAVLAMNDEMALGAVQAIKAAGKQDQIKLVGYNGALEAIKAVYTTDLAADVVQYPEEMGKLYVEWAVRILGGEKPADVNIHPSVSVVDTQLLAKLKLAVGE